MFTLMLTSGDCSIGKTLTKITILYCKLDKSSKNDNGWLSLATDNV